VAIKSSPGGKTLTLKLFQVTGAPTFADGVVDGVAFPAGVAALASVGTAVATGGAIVSAVGVSSLASLGTAAATGGAFTTIVGVATSAAVGAATGAGAGTTAVVGVAAAATMGTATATGTAVTAPAGVGVVASVGTSLADGGPADGIAAPLGVEMVASVGTAVAFDADAVVISSGVGSWRRHRVADQRERRVFVTVFPSGVEVTARVGRTTASGDAVVAVDGVQADLALGEALASADVVVETVGAASATAMGTAAVFDVHVLPVLPYTPVETRSIHGVGNRPLSSSIPVADGAGSHPAPDAIDRAWTDLQGMKNIPGGMDEDDELVLLGVLA